MQPQMPPYQPSQQHFQAPMQQMHQMQPVQNMGQPPMQFVPQYQAPFGAPQHQVPPLQVSFLVLCCA